MGVVQNIIGIVRGINDRKRTHAVNEELKNYLADPNAAIAAVNQIDAPAAIALDRQRRADEASRIAAGNAAADRGFALTRDMLRGLPEDADVGAAYDKVSPFLQTLGVRPEQLAGFRDAVTTNRNVLLDDDAYKALMTDRYETKIGTPGSHVIRGGQVIDKVPFAIKAETTPAGSSTNIFNPNTGRFETGGAPSAPAITSPADNPPMGAQPTATPTLGLLRPLFRAQESSGDYTAVNPETGALGVGQVMPKTGQALAKRLGLAWRPDMMKKNDPASMRYQDAISDAAMQESIDAGGGDLAKTFSHYYSGSTTAYQNPKGNPKTAKYVQEMLARAAKAGAPAPANAGEPSAGGVVVTPTSVVVPPKPAAPKNTYRAATPQELAAAGYPKGTAAQVGTDGKMVNVKTPPAANQPKPYDQEKARSTADSLTTFTTMATELLNDRGLDGAVGNFQGRMPGLLLSQAAVNFRNKLDSFKSNIGLNKLMELKAASTQGASGFGNLSNEEGRRLEQAFGTLEGTNDESVIRANLKIIIDTSQRAAERVRWQAERADAGLPYSVPAVGTIRDGMRFMGGSPANPANWAKVRSAKK